MNSIFRSVSVNGRSGIIAAQNGGKGAEATHVFVLFDGDDASESMANWFDVSTVEIANA